MTDSQRNIGGVNNRKGNRYEDAFAVFRCLELAVPALIEGIPVTLEEQVDCPVDDLRIVVQEQSEYYQLKDHQTISWALGDGKLTREFRMQRDCCQELGESFIFSICGVCCSRTTNNV